MRVVILVTVLLLSAACGLAGSAGTMTVKTSGAEVSSLARYKTYMHATAENSPEGYGRGPLRPVVLEKVRLDVDAQLQMKGYTLAEYGELVVRISTGRRTIEDQPSGGAALAGAPATLETEGALVIDIIERASGQQVFHGFARDVVRGNEVKDEQLVQAVSRIVEPIPMSAR